VRSEEIVSPDLHLRAANPRDHKFTLEGSSEKALQSTAKIHGMQKAHAM
jgi:hypothetical protein